MGREEQVEEREVLASIFPDEITDLDETHFRVAVALDVASQDDDQEAKPVIVLDVTFPEKYPDVAPHLELANPHDAPKPPRLDLSEDRPALLAAIEPTIEESLGMAMIFSVVTALKDAAEQLIEERATAADQEREAELRAEEERENAKFHGEKVTRERFLEWRQKFQEEAAEDAKRKAEEMEAAAAKKIGKSVAASHAGKLSGRELWERGLAKDVDDEEGDDPDDTDSVHKGVKEMNIQ